MRVLFCIFSFAALAGCTSLGGVMTSETTWFQDWGCARQDGVCARTDTIDAITITELDSDPAEAGPVSGYPAETLPLSASPKKLRGIEPFDFEEFDAEIERAKVHVELCCELYKYQLRCGRYFLHERPTTATSSKLPCIEELAANPMVLKARTHMCESGATAAVDDNAKGLVKKPTTMMTNSVEVHCKLDTQCTPGTYRHMQLRGGKARDAAIYPKALCRAVCRGVARQMEIDASDLISLKYQVSERIAVDDV